MTGPQLIEWRKSRRWTQTQLADALGVSRWAVARYEAAEAVPQVVALALSALKMPRQATGKPVQRIQAKES